MTSPLGHKTRSNGMPLKLDSRVICNQCDISPNRDNHNRGNKLHKAIGIERQQNEAKA